MATIDEILSTALDHHRAGRWQQAEQLYRQVLQADPNHPDAIHLLGVLAHQVGKSEIAVSVISQAIGLRGDIPRFHNNLGEAYRRLRRFGEAIAAYQQALRLDPDFAEAHNNLGTVHQNQGWLPGAMACYERALECDPDYVNAHYNRARCWLSMGDFEQGWPEYEWRWQRAEFRMPPLTEPAWDGSPLRGRTLLVRAEQGLGDTLQFIRYVRLLHRAGDQVLVEVQQPLIPLLSESGFTHLIPQAAPLPRFDVHAPLLSLPNLFRTALETVPAEIPYLSANPELAGHWRRKLDELGGFTIGICWQGNRQSPLEPWRSIPLAAFEPLTKIAGVRLVSLQKGPGLEQIPAVAERFSLLDLAPQLDEEHGPFMDTAALTVGLDLVITSDSAVAHLAGALGANVWVALPVSADWRWLQARSDSPWYPTMRLFRQARPGEWSSVFEQIAAELTALVRQT